MSATSPGRAPAHGRVRSVGQSLASNRVGPLLVLSFVLAAIAPLTVAAGVIPTAFATTRLADIPAAFVVMAVILAVFAAGYLAMARRITHAGALYAFISRGLGRPAGVAAALVALLAYNLLQIGLYGALGPAAAAEASAHLGIHAQWWEWALLAWALVAVLGRLSVDVAARVLVVLQVAELIVVAAEVTGGLSRPAGGHLSLSTLSPARLAGGGVATLGVLAVIAALGFVGFEQAPVFSEEARSRTRTVPAATYTAVGVIGVLYAAAGWAMAAHAGTANVAAAAAAQGPALLFGLAGSGWLAQAAQLLFITSLLAAALAFHSQSARYTYALAREGVLPAVLSRTSGSGVPYAASYLQSAAALIVLLAYAIAGLPPMTDLFFWLGTTGGLGVVVLLTLTSAAVIAFFARDARGANLWERLVAPAVACAILTVLVVLAVGHYATLLGVPPGSPAARILPACYAAAGGAGLGWALVLRRRRPDVYRLVGLGPQTLTGLETSAVATEAA